MEAHQSRSRISFKDWAKITLSNWARLIISHNCSGCHFSYCKFYMLFSPKVYVMLDYFKGSVIDEAFLLCKMSKLVFLCVGFRKSKTLTTIAHIIYFAGLPLVTTETCPQLSQQSRTLLPCPSSCPSNVPQSQAPQPPPQTALLPTPTHTHTLPQHPIGSHSHNHMLSQVR